MPIHEPGEKARRQLLQKPHEIADPQMGAGAHRPQLTEDVVVLLQVFPRPLLQQLAGGGQAHPAGGPDKKGRPDLLFQPGHRFAQGLLADVQLLGRPVDAFFFAYFAEKFQLFVIHACLPGVTTCDCTHARKICLSNVYQFDYNLVVSIHALPTVCKASTRDPKERTIDR